MRSFSFLGNSHLVGEAFHQHLVLIGHLFHLDTELVHFVNGPFVDALQPVIHDLFGSRML